MSNTLKRAGVAFAALSFINPVLGAIRFDPEKMMRAAEVQRGMEGEALTVFHGVTPTRFRVRILGVIPKGIMGEPYIIFRALDGPLVERDAPVMGGMSGSPIFINGKLVGAIAFTYLYEKEPCGGATPIEAMLLGVTGQRPALSYRYQPVMIAGRVYTRAAEVGRDPMDHQTLPLQAASAPVCFTAGTPRSDRWQRSLLGLLGLDARPGAGSHPSVPAEMVPGAGFGVALAQGDLLSYTFGTVTWRDGDDVLGFGHPFLSLGKLTMPLTTVFIHDFVSSYRRTDKDGSIMDTVGALTYDSPWGVAGAVGASAETVPAVYRIVDETADRSRVFQLQLCRHRSVTPPVALGSLFEAVGCVYHAAEKPGIARVHYRVRGSKGAVIERTEIYAHGGDPSPAIGAELGEVMGLLVDNRFEPQEITDVAVETHLIAEQRVARIERVYTEEEAAVAGRKLTVHVLLKPVGAPAEERVVRFDLPADLPKGSVSVGVAGGLLADALRQQLGGFTPEFHSLDRIIKYLQSLETNDQLLVMLALPTRGAAVEDTPLPDLPGVMYKRLAQAHRTGVRAIRDYEMKTLATPWVVEGAYLTTLATVNRQGERGKPEAPEPKRQAAAFMAGLHAAAAMPKLRPAVIPVTMGTVPVLRWSAEDVEAEDALPRVLAGGLGAPVVLGSGAQAGDDEKGDESDEEKPQEQSQESKTEAKPPAAEAKPEEAKPKPEAGQVQPAPGQWLLGKYEELAKGTPDGLAVHARGWLVPGVRLRERAQVGEPPVWDLAADGETTYVAAGLEATVYRAAGSEVVPFFRASEGLFVSALSVLRDGTLACAVVPHAKVFFVGRDGTVQRTVAFYEQYIWDLLPQGDELLVATGSPARVYKLSPVGEKSLLAVVPENHVVALAAAGDSVYGATAEEGVLYRLGSGGRVEQLLRLPATDATGLAALPDGTVVVSAAKAAIFALRPNGTVEQWYKNDEQEIWALAADGQTVLAALGSPAMLLRARAPEDYELLAVDRGQDYFAAVGRRGDGAMVVAGCAPPVLLAQEAQPAELAYTSAAYDASLPARWLRGFVDTDTAPEVVTLQLRTGATETYEGGLWSSWTTAVGRPAYFVLEGPPGRYVQMRLSVPPTTAAPIKGLLVEYSLQNQRPSLKVTAPAAGGAVSGETEVKWEASDPDKDTTEVALWLQARGTTEWTPVAERLASSPYKWDTKGLKDGVYRLRAVASDRPSRPTDALEIEALVAPLVVDNTKPEGQLTSPARRAEDGSVPVEVVAHDALSGVAGVAWQYPGTEVWYTAATSDGAWGGEYEVCTFTLPKAIKGGTKVVVRVRDLAGNITDLTVTMPHEAQPAPAQSTQPAGK
ncbi:MAG: hypothetical protein N2512_04405 [Armatimonadetes bacterium]|nr:hypothetical protein [Armatimonadota bacterium]